MSNFYNFDIEETFSKFTQRWHFFCNIYCKKISILGSLDISESANSITFLFSTLYNQATSSAGALDDLGASAPSVDSRDSSDFLGRSADVSGSRYFPLNRLSFQDEQLQGLLRNGGRRQLQLMFHEARTQGGIADFLFFFARKR